MFFKAELTRISDVLDANHRAARKYEDNAADIGYLRETFARDMLDQVTRDNFWVFKGGQIIDSRENTSKQMDIVVTSMHGLRLFTEKGKFPVEAVLGAFCITSNLDMAKLQTDVDVIKSIPREHPEFEIARNLGEDRMSYALTSSNRNAWLYYCPVRCVFGFSGNLNGQAAADWLNQQIVSGVPSYQLPDFVVVNRKCLVRKVQSARNDATGKSDCETFVYEDVSDPERVFIPFSFIFARLAWMLNWEAHAKPSFEPYFRADILTSPPSPSQM